MHYEMKPYPLSSSSRHRATDKVVMKRESEAIHVGCVTEGMDNDRVGYNTATAQCGIQVALILLWTLVAIATDLLWKAMRPTKCIRQCLERMHFHTSY